jgi:hypothetical protein
MEQEGVDHLVEERLGERFGVAAAEMAGLHDDRAGGEELPRVGVAVSSMMI